MSSVRERKMVTYTQKKIIYQPYRFIKATTFTGIPLHCNQRYLDLVCLNSQTNFPNAD